MMKKQEKNKGREISQEFLYKLSVFEKQIEQLNQQLQLIEKSVIDLNSLNFGMDEIKGSVGKEILAQLGRGIFVKTKLISDELVVDVGEKNFVKKSVPETKKIINGEKNFVKKSVPETKKIIKEQIEKLNQLKKELEDKIGEIDKEVAELVLNSSAN
jgi:prefoldin alpha subunit